MLATESGCKIRSIRAFRAVGTVSGGLVSYGPGSAFSSYPEI